MVGQFTNAQCSLCANPLDSGVIAVENGVAEQEQRKAFLPAQSSDFIVTVAGRELRWLSRIVGFVLAPLLRWRARRQHRRG